MDPNELLLRDKKQLILLILDPSLVGYSFLLFQMVYSPHFKLDIYEKSSGVQIPIEIYEGCESCSDFPRSQFTSEFKGLG